MLDKNGTHDVLEGYFYIKCNFKMLSLASSSSFFYYKMEKEVKI